MYPHIPAAVANNKKLKIDSFEIYSTNCLRWYSYSFYLWRFIADSEIGIIGVFLNYSTGRNSMKFLGSSASIEPGMDKLTIKSFLKRYKYLDSAVSSRLN